METRGVRPRNLDKPEKQYVGKRFIGALMPDQIRETKKSNILSARQISRQNAKVAKGMEKLKKIDAKRASLEEKLAKKQLNSQIRADKILEKQRVRMAKQAKKDEIKQAVADLKILRQELKLIK